MGKKKNKNKLSGAAKTAIKTEKKLKKALANLGEEDITKVVAEIEREEARKSAASEKTLKEPPSPRAYASLTPHPINNELIMFGGEYHNGQKTETYNALLFYNPTNNTWRQVKAPGGPAPRSGHQAIATPANRGELWVFGGEFTSPSETQFHHYKDLWCYLLADKKWEKVNAPNGPSARSGHRMTLVGRSLFVFGGYSDNGRQCRYFDDLYSFSLDTRTWAKITPSGRGPAARAACILLPAGNDSLIVYGGFSRIRKGSADTAYTHTDMFRLTSRPVAGGGDGVTWTWRGVGGAGGGAGSLPARAAQAFALNPHTNRGYVFGGITDMNETEEELVGELSDDLQMLDLDGGRWHNVTLKSEQQTEQNTTPTAARDQRKDDEQMTILSDEVFTVKIGSARGGGEFRAGGESPAALGDCAKVSPGPGPRMATMMAVQRSTLYLYGGLLERGDDQFYLGDMYSLDLHKLNEWKTIIEQTELPGWFGSAHDEDESDDDESEEDDSESDSESGSDVDD